MFTKTCLKSGMRACILFALAGCILLPSCRHDLSEGTKPDPSQYICFGRPVVSFDPVDVSQRSKTGLFSVLHNALPDGASFGVVACCVPFSIIGSSVSSTPDYASGSSDWENKKQLVHADVFYKQEVIYNKGLCSYRNLKRWYLPEDVPGTSLDFDRFRYSFFAYYPFGERFSVDPGSADALGTPKITFTMPFAKASTNTNTAAIDHNLIPDAMVAARYDLEKASGNVTLTFYHMLTGLRFRVNNYDETRDLTIHSLTFSGQFYRSLTLDFDSANHMAQKAAPLNEDCYRGTFTIVSERDPLATRQCIRGSSKLMGESDGDGGVTVLLLPDVNATPNDATNPSYYLGNDKTITITYSFDGEETKTQTIPDIKLAYKPVQSTRYTANLNFAGDRFALVFVADNNEHWEGEDENDLIIQ